MVTTELITSAASAHFALLDCRELQVALALALPDSESLALSCLPLAVRHWHDQGQCRCQYHRSDEARVPVRWPRWSLWGQCRPLTTASATATGKLRLVPGILALAEPTPVPAPEAA